MTSITTALPPELGFEYSPARKLEEKNTNSTSINTTLTPGTWAWPHFQLRTSANFTGSAHLERLRRASNQQILKQHP